MLALKKACQFGKQSFIDPIIFKEEIQISGDMVYYADETTKKFNCTLASEN